MSELHMMVGPSGSGKSKYAQDLWLKLVNEDQHVASIIATDQIREKLCGKAEDQTKNKEVFFLAHCYLYNNLSAQYMLRENHVIFDATNYSRFSRENPIMITKLCGAKVIGYFFQTPIEECKRRNELRERKVPPHIIEKQFAKFEIPTLEEGIDEIIYV